MSKISLKHSGGNVVSLNSPTNAPSAADVAFKLPNADGTSGQVLKTDGSGNLSWVSSGISMIDGYRLSIDSYNGIGAQTVGVGGNSASSGASTWERWNSDISNGARAGAVLGTGLGYSSGIFSFPSTGIYQIQATFVILIDDGDTSAAVNLHVTTDNSNYYNTARCIDGNNNVNNGNMNRSGSVLWVFDVTNISTHKFKFMTDSFAGNTTLKGENSNFSFMSVIKLGDT
mgnify:CR=1 FL=1|tara:strand:- start:866 stop:1552 length:687 start_codon:yes stop_codon:yes gene_type:complete